MQTITIEIKAETIYIADNILREKAMLNKCFPVGVTKNKTKQYLYRNND